MRENKVLFYQRKRAHALFPYAKLSQLHSSLGHPSASTLYNVLKRARPKEVSESVKGALHRLNTRCEICFEMANRPKRFELTVGNEDARSSHSVAADVVYIRTCPVLHVVDEATHFSAALFLRNMPSRKIWKKLLRCWIHVYMGPPDYLRLA